MSYLQRVCHGRPFQKGRDPWMTVVRQASFQSPSAFGVAHGTTRRVSHREAFRPE
jgi:hypothetical protein